MKIKSIAATLLFAGFSIAASNFAGAASTLLFGFTVFDTNSGNQAATTTATNFSASVNKALASSNVGGSSDGAYGPALGTGGVGGNGFIDLSTSSATVFTLTNSTGNAYALDFLYFDIIRNAASGSGTASVDYSNDGGTATTVLNQELLDLSISSGVFSGIANNVDNNLASSGIDADYSDRIGSLAGVILGSGKSITFSFATASTNMRLDNIAVTGSAVPSGVPEPGSFLALGCVLATGLGLRSRSRRAAQAA